MGQEDRGSGEAQAGAAPGPTAPAAGEGPGGEARWSMEADCEGTGAEGATAWQEVDAVHPALHADDRAQAGS